MLFILISGIQRGWGEVAEHLELGYFSIVPLLNGRYLLASSLRSLRLLLDWQCLLVAQAPKTERCLGQ